MRKATILLFTILLAATACATPPQDRNDPASTQHEAMQTDAAQGVYAQLPEPVTVQAKGITFTTNPAMELMMIALQHSDYAKIDYPQSIPSFTYQYKRDADEYFSAFANHEFVQYIDRTFRSIDEITMPVIPLLYCKGDFALDEAYHRPSFLTDFFATFENFDINELLSGLKQFYIDTNFAQFYEEHRDFYLGTLEKAAATLPDWDMVKALEAFYGVEMRGYNIVLLPILNHGNFGPFVERADGRYLYAILGPSEEDGDGLLSYKANDISYYILHEMGHSFIDVNDVNKTPELQKAVDESRYLFERIKNRLDGYNTWDIAFEELLIRGVVIQLLLDNDPSADRQALIQMELNQGFDYIETALESIERYAESRDEYPSFEDYIPVLTRDLMEEYPE